MIENFKRDPRIPQAKKLFLALIGKSEIRDSKVLITSDGFLVILIKDTVMYRVPLNIVHYGPSIGYDVARHSDIGFEDDDVYIEANFHETRYVQELYNSCMNTIVTYGNHILCKTDARLDENFEKLTKLKSADGAKFYIIEDLFNRAGVKFYTIPIFSGFPALNKADTVNINLYRIVNEPLYFLVSMDIYKKKINRNISLIYKAIDLSKQGGLYE